jgi:hypothetical protein
MPIDPTLGATNANPAVTGAGVGGPTQPGSPTVSSPQTQGFAGQGLKFAQDLMALTQAKQNSAMQQIDRNLKAAEAGFPVDKTHLVKLAKTAGIKIASDPASLQAYIDSAHGQNPGPTGSSSQSPQTGGPGQGGQGKPQQGQPNAVQGVQKGQQSVKDQKKQVADIWAQRAVEAAQKRGESAARIGELADQVTRLKLDIIGDNKEAAQKAMGKLMAMNAIPFNLQQLEWENMSPEQKESTINIASGHESEAETQTRVSHLGDTMIANGRFADPGMAYKAATAIAHGQPIPPDAQKAIKPFTMNELADQAGVLGQLVSAGVPASKLASTMAAASVGGLANALPTGINPVILQQMSLQNKELELRGKEVGIQGYEAQTGRAQLGLEQQRIGLEQERLSKETSMAQAASEKAENQEFFQNFQALVMMKKAGANVPKEVMQSYTSQLAERSGMDVTSAKHWYEYITGGSHLEFSPKPASGLASSAAGRSPTVKDNPQGVGKSIEKFYQKTKQRVTGQTN